MIIDVTQHNIDDALRYRRLRGVLGCRCPIALAGKDAGLRSPEVSSASLTYRDDEDTVQRVMLPPAARDFVERFDNAEYVEPFAFSVEIVGVAA